MNENSLIRDIGRSYIVSSMLPAAFFITLGVFIYRDSIPQLLSAPIFNDKFSASLYFLFAGLIMWVGFGLYSMVNWTVRLYEGYYLPPFLKKFLVWLCFSWRHRNKTKNINKVVKAIKERHENWEEIIHQNYEQAWTDYSDVELTYPLREDDLLPTQLGNVLRASEQYPEKYGLKAGIELWSRLSTLLPINIANTLEEKNNNLLFLLNSSFLSYVLGMISLVLWGFCRINQSCFKTLCDIQNLGVKEGLSCYYIKGLSVPDYLYLGLFWIFLGYVLYILSIPVAKTMGLLIRSSFDLYRFDLLKQLNYSIPATLKQEQKVWARISEFIVTGGKLGTVPLDFDYNLGREYLNDQEQIKIELLSKKKSGKKGKR